MNVIYSRTAVGKQCGMPLVLSLHLGRDVNTDYKPRQPFYATAAALSPMSFSQTRQSMTPPPGQSQNLPVGGPCSLLTFVDLY